MTTVQLNTRIDANLKERGDRVFVRRGFTASSAIRALWTYADEHGDVPPFMLESQTTTTTEGCGHLQQRAQEGYGMAVRMARALTSETSTFKDVLTHCTWEQLHEEMYNERLADMDERLADMDDRLVDIDDRLADMDERLESHA